ncbi:MAG: non-heme iron oxygenase ferredoxin subunit [Anaerolineae bacterium]|nr:non-heme iron oxygenase ferredoxin subunit [Anaerolineae bacterium]
MAEFVTVATVDEVPPGERIVVEVDDHFIAVFNVGGKYYAIEDVCTHDGGPLAEGTLEDYRIECPRHGGAFDIRSGKVLSWPATQPVPWYEVRVVDDEIQVALG